MTATTGTGIGRTAWGARPLAMKTKACPIYSFLRSRSVPRADTQDITQLVLLKLCDRYGESAVYGDLTSEQLGKAKRWALNLYRDHLRSERRRRDRQFRYLGIKPFDPVASEFMGQHRSMQSALERFTVSDLDPSQAELGEVYEELIRWANTELPLQQRRVIELLMDGLSTSEVAEELQIQVGSARKLRSRAIATIRESVAS